MHLSEIGWVGVNWFGLTLNRDKWRVVVNTAMNSRVLKMRAISWLAEKPLASQEELFFMEFADDFFFFFFNRNVKCAMNTSTRLRCACWIGSSNLYLNSDNTFEFHQAIWHRCERLHETGRIPDAVAEALWRLSQTPHPNVSTEPKIGQNYFPSYTEK